MALPLAIPLILAGAQAVSGLIKGDNAAEKAKGLRASRKSFKTTQEVYDIQNATENRAQTGYDPATLEYLTNEIDRAASGAYGTAKRLGGNANDLSSIFDQQVNKLMQVGGQSAALKMENFSKYLSGKELLSKNLEAEWASQQAMIKDDLQAAGQERQEAAAQVSNGLSNILSTVASSQVADLYKPQSQSTTAPTFTTDPNPQFDFSRIGYSTKGYLPNPATDVIDDSVSQVVTPSLSAMRRGGQTIIGVAPDGSFIYGR